VEHIQANMIVGLDSDEELPFLLSKQLATWRPDLPDLLLVTNFYNAP
jgi:hypothetical protein